MAIVLGLVIAVVVAAVAAVVVSSTRRQLGEQVAAAEAARDEAAAALAAVTAERDELRSSRDWFEASAGRANLEVERQRDRADDLATRLAEAESAAAAASAADGDGGDGLWLLLLAHVARRWGAMVGVPPEGRAVVAGPPADQLAEALAREIERLREEVGVDVEMAAAAPATGAEGEGAGAARLGDDPADRVPALLAALELLGVLTATSEQVTVALGDELVLTGDGWFDPAGELAAARDRAAAAGATVGPVTASGEQVEVILRRSGVQARN